MILNRLLMIFMTRLIAVLVGAMVRVWLDRGSALSSALAGLSLNFNVFKADILGSMLQDCLSNLIEYSLVGGCGHDSLE